MPVGYYYSTKHEFGPANVPDLTGLKVIQNTSDSITVSWDKMDGALQYNARCSADSEVHATDKTSFKFEQLDPDTEYHIEVNYVTKEGGSFTSEIDASTLPAEQAKKRKAKKAE